MPAVGHVPYMEHCCSCTITEGDRGLSKFLTLLRIENKLRVDGGREVGDGLNG